MIGHIRSVPQGHHRQAVISGGLAFQGSPAALHMFPCALSVDVGETRRVDGRMSAGVADEHSFVGHDISVTWRHKLHTALVELRVGDLIVDIPGPGQDILGPNPGDPVSELFARGTAVLRWAEVSGTFFGEGFRLQLIELDQLQLIQNDEAWLGQFFQVVTHDTAGKASRTLAQQIRAAASLSDLGGIVRRTAVRYLKASS